MYVRLYKIHSSWFQRLLHRSPVNARDRLCRLQKDGVMMMGPLRTTFAPPSSSTWESGRLIFKIVAGVLLSVESPRCIDGSPLV